MIFIYYLGLMSTFFLAASLWAEGNADLAKQLANPVAALISVPFQFNVDTHIGAKDEGDRYLLNIKPVLPFSISGNWNLISRTILPVIQQEDIFWGSGSQSGIGDVLQSFFFSPKAPTSSGWILGAGPVFQLNTATDDYLGSDQWSAGPTAVALKQKNNWTYGGLVNHVWSVDYDKDQKPINASFLQPFLSYTTTNAVTITLNSESAYDWAQNQWAFPVNLVVAKVFQLGPQMLSLGAGVRYWLATTDSSGEGFGGRLMLTLLYPK